MQKYWAYFTVGASIVGLVIILAISCGKPVPPSPVPSDVDYTLNGETVILEAKLKAGASVGLEDVKRALKTAAQLIDSKK